MDSEEGDHETEFPVSEYIANVGMAGLETLRSERDSPRVISVGYTIPKNLEGDTMYVKVSTRPTPDAPLQIHVRSDRPFTSRTMKSGPYSTTSQIYDIPNSPDQVRAYKGVLAQLAEDNHATVDDGEFISNSLKIALNARQAYDALFRITSLIS